MRAYDLILKKREGQSLAYEEIESLIHGYAKGEIPDYQVAAWLMAVYFQGMTKQETADLTMTMVSSGETIDLTEIEGIKVDKHSTGGVGDTTTLVLAPLVAAAGVVVAKMSGRGLGHTGGTLDKLESIPGFRVNLTREEFISNTKNIGLAVMGQTANLVPADGKMYALRDVTATVDSIPLIASSIMSKKIAAGTDAIVLDVKTGRGAFMKTLEDSVQLAKAMVEIGRNVGRRTTAIVTDMDQPLGLAIGNALEVEEAIAVLRGKGPSDLRELCLELGARMVYLAKKSANLEEAKENLTDLLAKGAALEKFGQMIEAQGGDRRVLEGNRLLPQAKIKQEILAPKSGYIAHLEAGKVGLSAMILGAGREKKEDRIDAAAGVLLKKKVGDQVVKGEVLAVLHTSDHSRLSLGEKKLLEAYTISSHLVEMPPLIYQTLEE